MFIFQCFIFIIYLYMVKHTSRLQLTRNEDIGKTNVLRTEPTSQDHAEKLIARL